MSAAPILQISPLGFPWETIDPFLFCDYHDDAYPRGNAQFGPDASLAGRKLGEDFAGKDGWRMYHGLQVPGSVAPAPRIRDRDDRSQGTDRPFRFARRRSPLRRRRCSMADRRPRDRACRDVPSARPRGTQPLELFQIWLNLPARSKFVPPHFTMFWAEQIPQHVSDGMQLACIAGRYADAGTPLAPLAPPPDSYASQAESDLAIWTLRMAPGARWTLPAASGNNTRRKLYFFKGTSVAIGGQSIDSAAAIELRANADVELVKGPAPSEFLMLQGKPIGEPVAQYGPFVMNTEQELKQAYADYRRTEYGGWPWPDSAPVHGSARERFARHADGRTETWPAHRRP